jgi:tetratricopeptide (TPR) repeat protein
MIKRRSPSPSHRRGPLAVVLTVAMALLAGLADPQALDDELVKGKQEVRSGAYDAGIITLSAVVRRLGGAEGREAEAAEAYLNLGIAYAGLGQVSPARSQFVQALLRNPQIALDPGVPPSAVEIFAAARKEADEQGLLKGAPKKSALAGAPPRGERWAEAV